MSDNQLLLLQNEFVSFTLNSDASGELRDKAGGRCVKLGRVATQEFGPIQSGFDGIFYRYERSYSEEYPGWFSGESLGGGKVRFTLSGRLGRKMGRFVVSYRLDGQWLEVNIEQIDEQLASLVFPTAFDCRSLVIPMAGSAGQLLREPYPGRMFLDAFDMMTMPWFGGLAADGDAGWMGVLSQGYYDAGVHVLGYMACPGWLRSLGAWKSPRQVRYCLTSGGYVGMAKVYRRLAIEQGKHRPLRDRVKETPQLDSLIGGRIIAVNEGRTYHKDTEEQFGQGVPKNADEMEGKIIVWQTHKQVASMVQEAKALGMKRGLINVRGWIRGGYDETHPDIWPPEPAFGTMQDLKDLMTRGPVLGALHDNYQDIYERSPNFDSAVGRLPDGTPRFGGMWMGGQAYIMCSKRTLPFVRENWGKIKSNLNPAAMFIDTTTASPLYECYDPAHPVSRADDEQNKLEMIRILKKDGVLVGTESNRDFPAALIDWFENGHGHKPGESIPLWSLVYHDSNICTRFSGHPPMGLDGAGTGALNYLTDMLWGYLLFFNVREPQTWEATKEGFKQTLFADEWNRRIGFDEMVNHRFLSDDFLVEKTEFSSGAAIIVNYAKEPRTIEGKTVPACGHLILG